MNDFNVLALCAAVFLSSLLGAFIGGSVITAKRLSEHAAETKLEAYRPPDISQCPVKLPEPYFSVNVKTGKVMVCYYKEVCK